VSIVATPNLKVYIPNSGISVALMGR